MDEEPGRTPMQLDLTQIIATGLAAIMTMITFILGIYRGFVVEHYGGTYFMLALSFLLLVVLESLMISYGRKGDLSGDKTKFVYAFAIITLMQSVFFDIALFS